MRTNILIYYSYHLSTPYLLEDIASGDPSAIAWITFSGLPGESPTKFVQSVQRIGFSQGKVRDDGWLAGFVTTCFEGDALCWYSDLDAEIQESWEKLKIELLRRYGSSAGRLPSTSMLKPGVSNKPVTRSSSPHLPSQDIGTHGWIEVLQAGARTVMLGYLSYDKAVGVNITTDQDKALILALPTGKLSAPMHLYTVGIFSPLYADISVYLKLIPFRVTCLQGNHSPI